MLKKYLGAALLLFCLLLSGCSFTLQETMQVEELLRGAPAFR